MCKTESMAAAPTSAAAALKEHEALEHSPPPGFPLKGTIDLLKKDVEDKLKEAMQLQDFLKWHCLHIILSGKENVLEDKTALYAAAQYMPALVTQACLWCRKGLLNFLGQLTLGSADIAKVQEMVEFNATLTPRDYDTEVDLSFKNDLKTAKGYEKAAELCNTSFFKLSNSEFARHPQWFSSMLKSLLESKEPVEKLTESQVVQDMVKKMFLGWHCAHEDGEGLSHTAVALAPRKQPMTGKRIQKHIDTVGGLQLIANAPAAVNKLEQRLLKANPPRPVEDHPYRLFLTLLFNNGRGTVVRGETPVVLVNPVVVHVHGTYLSSMATECAVRGWVEPSPSFSLIEQMVMQEIMAEYKATIGLYGDSADPRLGGFQRSKPHEHALWHRFNVEGASPRPPACARDILIVQNENYLPDTGKAVAKFKEAAEALAAARELDKRHAEAEAAKVAADGADSERIKLLEADIAKLEAEKADLEEAAKKAVKAAITSHEIEDTFEEQFEQYNKAASASGSSVLMVDAAQNLVIRCMFDLYDLGVLKTTQYAFDKLVEGTILPNYSKVFFELFPNGNVKGESAAEVKAALSASLEKHQISERAGSKEAIDSPLQHKDAELHIYVVDSSTALVSSLLEILKIQETTAMTMSAVAYGKVRPLKVAPKPLPDPVKVRRFCETRVKLAANTAAAFQAAAVIFVAQSDGGSKFRDREGRAAARGALQTAVRAMLYDV